MRCAFDLSSDIVMVYGLFISLSIESFYHSFDLTNLLEDVPLMYKRIVYTVIQSNAIINAFEVCSCYENKTFYLERSIGQGFFIHKIKYE